MFKPLHNWSFCRNNSGLLVNAQNVENMDSWIFINVGHFGKLSCMSTKMRTIQGKPLVMMPKGPQKSSQKKTLRFGSIQRR